MSTTVVEHVLEVDPRDEPSGKRRKVTDENEVNFINSQNYCT
jgi:hypothetical protein